MYPRGIVTEAARDFSSWKTVFKSLYSSMTSRYLDEHQTTENQHLHVTVTLFFHTFTSSVQTENDSSQLTRDCFFKLFQVDKYGVNTELLFTLYINTFITLPVVLSCYLPCILIHFITLPVVVSLFLPYILIHFFTLPC